ncbi:MAG: LysR family transcriptional regulator, partial [Lachnospiraceae bacterium]|nr:LysR family transcriptional regulator [Lachnospiraceae bacterium]
MTLKHLNIFSEVCRAGSITKAAEKLNMAQPAVSNAIRERATYYGVRLFDRMNRRIYIT